MNSILLEYQKYFLIIICIKIIDTNQIMSLNLLNKECFHLIEYKNE
jgi:hypothetical protein